MIQYLIRNKEAIDNIRFKCKELGIIINIELLKDCSITLVNNRCFGLYTKLNKRHFTWDEYDRIIEQSNNVQEASVR